MQIKGVCVNFLIVRVKQCGIVIHVIYVCVMDKQRTVLVGIMYNTNFFHKQNKYFCKSLHALFSFIVHLCKSCIADLIRPHFCTPFVTSPVPSIICYENYRLLYKDTDEKKLSM